MGVPNSEVGYTPAMPRREDHEVHKDMWWHWTPPPQKKRTKNITTNVVIEQHSRKFLMMDILMSETCWAHKKWNKIASDIKLAFYSSTISMMHGRINTSNEHNLTNCDDEKI